MERFDGLRAKVLPAKRDPYPLCLAGVLFLFLWAAFASLASLPLSALSLLSGAAVLVLCALLPPKIRLLVSAALVIGTALALALVPWLLVGGKALCNQLFAASEAANRYAYIRFALPPESEAALPLFRLLLGALGGLWCFWSSRKGLAALTLAVALAALEAYLGLTPALWQNAALFLLLGLCLLPRAPLSRRWAVPGAAALVMLCVSVALPGVDGGLEQRSEQVRDYLGQALQEQQRPVTRPQEQQSVRKETLLQEGGASQQTSQDYEKETDYHRQLSLPKTTPYRKIILLLLATALVLILPFLPFYLLDRRRRRAQDRRAAFEEADCAAAIRAMFPHVVRCLTAFSLPRDNVDFSALAEQTEAIFPPDYARAYREGVDLWQEAAYSDHAMTDAQRQSVAALVEATERLVFAAANRRQRFRLRYIDCLIFPEGTL